MDFWFPQWKVEGELSGQITATEFVRIEEITKPENIQDLAKKLKTHSFYFLTRDFPVPLSEECDSRLQRPHEQRARHQGQCELWYRWFPLNTKKTKTKKNSLN